MFYCRENYGQLNRLTRAVGVVERNSPASLEEPRKVFSRAEHREARSAEPENGDFVEQLPGEAERGVEVRRAESHDDHHHPDHVDAPVHEVPIVPE